MKIILKWAMTIAVVAVSSCVQAQNIEDANALYAESEWGEAAVAYEAIVESSPEDSAAWFGLAQSYHQLENYQAAESAYLKAQESGFQPVLRVHYHLGRVYMSMGDQEKALEQIEAIGEAGGISNQILLAVTEFEPLNDNPRYMAVIEQLQPCNTEHYRHFDFWLGQWDVTPAGQASATAKSSITSVQGGCVVLEEYETQGGFTGMSINFFDSNTGMWHQSWMSNGGGAVHLQGNLVDGAMVLSDNDLIVSEKTGTINRVTWSLLDDGRVRQHWENSTDGGDNWTTSFDGYYAQRTED
ncbi:MAG TPA: tetratricopeptide repeat protein [Xanthomonadales bacterium]|nr:tetratricopeptide repeat protein [Xanthomonadales bacterium]